MPSKRFSPHAIALAFSWFLFGLALLFCAQSAQTAYAQDITISGNTLWSAGTYTYANVWITNNATLTLQSDPATGEGLLYIIPTIPIAEPLLLMAVGAVSMEQQVPSSLSPRLRPMGTY